MSLQRRIEPEWLDRLPADDPRAIRSRRDLKRVNAWVMNARCMASALRKHAGGRQPRTILDLGGGDGQFILQVARLLAPQWRDVTVTLLDQQDIVSQATREGLAALRWRLQAVQGDVFEFLDNTRSMPVDLITANLFLHHFTDQQLSRLFAAAAQRAGLMVACEPRRAKFGVRASRMLWVIGCSDITVHDAVVSVRAGFDGNELSALWPSDQRWQLHEHPAALFTHCFVARRPAPDGDGKAQDRRAES